MKNNLTIARLARSPIQFHAGLLGFLILAANAIAASPEIVISEMLTHTDPPLEDAIEFYNTTDTPINMGGWIMVASGPTEKTKSYTLLNTFIVPARGYAVLYEYQFVGLQHLTFNSAHGGLVILYKPGFIEVTRQSYDTAANAVSFGRVETSQGVEFVALSARSFGQDKPGSNEQFRRGTGLPNPGPLVGPLVINEIMHHPPANGLPNNTLDEFIEIRNITRSRIRLFHPTYPGNRWQLRGSVTFDGFPPGTSIAPNGIFLVVSFDPVGNPVQLAAFRAKYNVDPSVPVFGPYFVSLDNNIGGVELVRPDAVQLPPHDDAGYVPYISVDHIDYRNVAPWPTAANGTGLSLQRRNRFLYGNEPLNWKASEPTAGQPNGTPPTITVQPLPQIFIESNEVTFVVAATGTAPFNYQWRHNGTNLPGATGQALTLASMKRSDLGSYAVAVSNDEGSTTSATTTLKEDLKVPTLRITSPRPNARVSNEVLVVQGTVKDNLGVSQVLVSLNDGESQSAQGTTNWSAEVQLLPGTNVIQAKALDLGLNESSIATLRVIFVVTSPLTITTSGAGSGSVSPDLNGIPIEVGRRYSLTALPAPGSLFSNWTGNGASGPISGDTSSFSFLMQSNLMLDAAFVPNPFPAVRGTYNGLFFEPGEVRHESSGFFTATVTEFGAFTASLQTGTKRLRMAGRFDLSGTASNRITLAGANALELQLTLDLVSGTDQITGTGTDGSWTAGVTADRVTFHPIQNPAPLAGSYTLVIEGSTNPIASPGGDGFGTAKIDGGGLVVFKGALGDGMKAAQKVALSKHGDWPFYVSLYGGKGSILGWVAVTNREADDLHGLLSWIKPAAPGKLYPAGFTTDAAVVGSRYTPPSGNQILDFTDAVVTFTGGNLAESFTNAVQLQANNKVINLSSNRLTLTLSLPTGTMSGTATDPASGRPVAFKGVVLQNPALNRGAGYFLGTNQSGRVHFGP